MQNILSFPLINPVGVFLLLLLIVLLMPRLMTLLRMPPIVGFVLAGMVIGPFGLHLLDRNAVIELFATIGLLYLMFLAGLQLDLNDFGRKRNRSLVFGLLTFAVPILLGFPACYFLLHQSLLASALTASMFATHTLVAYPIITRYALAGNEAVAVAVGGTILTDTAVLLIFSVIMSAFHGQLTPGFWLHLFVSVTAFSLIVFVGMPRVARWFLKRPSIEPTAPFVFILCMVFFAGFLAQLCGLEPIIGAFVAGLALNREVPAGSPLLERVSFTGNALFIPFFLISVGMLVDLRVLFKGTSALLVAVCLTVVALAGKWLAAWITQRIFNYSANQRKLIFGLSSSHAAATIAIILAGYKAGVIGADILNGTILLIMVTCLVASFVTENAAKGIRISTRK
jgi:Kef-type K+ transport system membrane component KefB